MENNNNLPAFIMAEHNNVARCGLSEMVSRPIKKNYRWVGNINSYGKLVTALQQHPHAVVLLCASLPDFDLPTHLSQLHHQFAQAKIILSSDNYSRFYTELVRQRSAAGYVVKCNLKASVLLKAVQTVISGQPFLPPEAAEAIQPHNNEIINLNDQRIRQIFYYILENKSQIEIARLTDISKTTVCNLHLYITTIAQQHSKYGVWGYAMLHHLLPLEMLREVDK